MRNCFLPTTRINFDMDDFFRDFGFGNFPIFQTDSKANFSPAVNIVDKGNRFDLTFELPGMDKGDIKILVKDNVLTVSGERKVQSEIKDDTFVRTEISSGSFSRSFNLGDSIDNDKVTADYRNGLLHVNLEKKEHVKPKEINVNIN